MTLKPTDASQESKSWQFASVGTDDLDVALDLWRDQFGMDVSFASAEDLRALATLWDMPPEEISRAALVGQPGAPSQNGQLLLVEFIQPKHSVREGAALYDSLPKNIDVYVDDIGTRVEALKAAGYSFRSESPQEFQTDGLTIREIHMIGHDEMNVVLLERVGAEFSFTNKGFYGVGMIIITVPDMDAEEAFFRSAFELETEADVFLEGPKLEQITGLPKGTQWIIKIFGKKGFLNGQLEIVEYRGVEDQNLYHRAVPGSSGLFEVTYQVPDIADVFARLSPQNAGELNVRRVSLFGACYEAVSIRSPAGMPVQMLARSECAS